MHWLHHYKHSFIMHTKLTSIWPMIEKHRCFLVLIFMWTSSFHWADQCHLYLARGTKMQMDFRSHLHFSFVMLTVCGEATKDKNNWPIHGTGEAYHQSNKEGWSEDTKIPSVSSGEAVLGSWELGQSQWEIVYFSTPEEILQNCLSCGGTAVWSQTFFILDSGDQEKCQNSIGT